MNQLWENISAFDIDQPIAEYGFSTRLAFENKWTMNFAKAAIEEYKKFMYLAAVSDSMVSPSPIVDVVWHQHLIFTHSYDAFCKVLGKKIDHIPSMHDPKETEKFKLAETRTTELYEKAFGPQPEAFWKYHTMPDSLPFEPANGMRKKIIYAGLLLFPLLAFAFTIILKPVFIDIDGKTFLWIYFVSFCIIFPGLHIYRDWYSKKIGRLISNNFIIATLSPGELIFMKSNRILKVIHGYVNHLIGKEIIVVKADRKLGVKNHNPLKNPIDKAIVDTINDVKTIFYSKLLGRLMNKPAFKQISRSAFAINDHFKDSKEFLKYFSINYFVLLVFLLIGISRLVLGITREKPSTFLVILLIVAIVLVIRHLKIESNFLIRQCIPDLYEKELAKQQENQSDWAYFLQGDAILLAAFVPLVTNSPEEQRAYWWNNSVCGSSGISCGGNGGSSACGSSCGGGCGGCGGGD